MGKVAVQLAEERILANGGKVVPSFKGAVRSDDLNTLEKGDQFTIPQDFKIYEQRVGNGSNVAQFIIVDVNGVAKNFYPSSLQKNLAIVDDNANSTGERAKTKGTACDSYTRNSAFLSCTQEDQFPSPHGVEPRTFRMDLASRLRSLYAQ